jgi:hypothetical protein
MKPAEASPEPSAIPSAVSAAPPLRETVNVAMPAPGARALDTFVIPKAAAEKAEKAAGSPVPQPADAAQARARISTRKAPDPRASSASSASKPAAVNAASAPPIAKAPITKAMTQAAAKILNADDLVASLPAKKTPPRAAAPRPVRPAKPAIGHPKSSSNPFDDRL